MSNAPLTPKDIETLRGITATHLRASVAGDWDRWTATCTDDVILVAPGERHIHGREAAGKFLRQFPRFVEFEGEPSVVRGSGGMAFTTGVGQAKLEVDGDVQDTHFKWLAVFERQADGGWKMVADAWNEQPVS